MAADSILMYLPGIVFLIAVSLLVAVPAALLVKRRGVAVLAATAVSTIFLQTWLFLDLGSIDPPFLVLLTVLNLLVALVSQYVVSKARAAY